MPFYQSNWNEVIGKPGPPAKLRSIPSLENDPHYTEAEASDAPTPIVPKKADVLAICEKLSKEVSFTLLQLQLLTFLLSKSRCKL